MKKYYQLIQNGTTADIYVYGDITSYPWSETDISSYGLAKELETLEAENINCYINSYGGEVAEGLAIYNQLKRHAAKVTTICDGFACSAASVIFMAGDERIMNSASLLMIHNAWSFCSGNSNELRKQADDLEVITQASINAYMSHVNIDEIELKALLDGETWILPEDALSMGFITSITDELETNQASQSVKRSVIDTLIKQKEAPSLEVKILDMPEMKVILENLKQSMNDLILVNGIGEPEKVEIADLPIAGSEEITPEPENKLLKMLQAYKG